MKEVGGLQGVDVIVASPAEVEKILTYQEGHFFDLKSLDITPGKLTRTLSAFANADGGELFVGIDENKKSGVRTWRGFAYPEAANAHIQVFDNLFPLGQESKYQFLATDDKRAGVVLHIEVHKTVSIKAASDSTPYIRRGAQNLPVNTPELLARLQRNKGVTSFENEAVGIPLDFVDNSEVIIGFMLSVVPLAEPLPWLKKQLLVRDGKPTVAAVLLYADVPQAALPKRSAIKIYRYKTTDKGSRDSLAFDPVTVEGCLYSQIEESVSRTVELIQEIQILGSSGLENIKYPVETLHEIITNALLHRDYGIADDVHVRIFDNRIEVESPGQLPAHVTVKNILEERFARNGNIVRLINKFPNPPNKDVGEGLNTAFSAMKKLKLRNPVIHQTDNSVIVEIRHQKLASPEQQIMEYLEEHGEIQNRTVRELTGIGSENVVKDIFYGLAKKKQIERVPNKNGRAAAWRLYTGEGEPSLGGDVARGR